jgi:hypothetical protein
MSDNVQTQTDQLQENSNLKINQEMETEKVLCPHCQRTATNGIKCKGICVADSDY